MPEKIKLELYKFTLNPKKDKKKTFRDFISLKSTDELTGDKEILFKNVFSQIIQEMDTDEFIQNKRKKKAFTAYNTSSNLKESKIKFDSEKEIIYGQVEGGRFGKKRTKTPLKNKSKKENVDIGDVILDPFYFCIYLPLKSKTGIIFIQKYSVDTVSDILTEYISTFFSFPKQYHKAKIEKFVPREIINDFKSNSNVKKFSFSSDFVYDVLNEDATETIEEVFQIKIEAISKNGLPIKQTESWLTSMQNKIFTGKKLQAFEKTKCYLEHSDTKAKTPFELDKEADILPVIFLNDKISINPISGIPDFDELHTYCMKILEEQIIPEIQLSNEIKEC